MMGSYGIGPARIAAAAVEQYADEQGISWPRAIAPWDVHLVALGKEGTDERALADRLYEELQAAGLEVLYDDRDMRPGREVRRGGAARLPAARRRREAQPRVRRARGAGAARARAARGAASRAPRRRWRALLRRAALMTREGRRIGAGRLLGLRRGGPEPPQTRAGAPLRPFTIPNLIGYVRIALLGVFVVVALSSDDGRDPLSTTCLRDRRGLGLPRRHRRARSPASTAGWAP